MGWANSPTDWQLIKPMLWNVGAKRKDERTMLPALWSTTRVPWRSVFRLSSKMVTPRPDLFFNRQIGTQRTGRGLKVPLSEFKALKDRFGCTVNDAVLAVVSEGLHRWFKARVQRDADGTFSIIARAHWALLAVSLITIAAAAAGSHGWSFGR